MFAELLNLENCDSLKKFMASQPHRPFGWALPPERQRAVVDYLLHGVQEAIDAGGFAKAYDLGGEMVGLCVTRPDNWASHELGVRTFRVTHLFAAGSPEMQTIVKAMLVRETVRSAPGRVCFVAQLAHTDLSGLNALERTGFIATQSTVVMALDLLDYQSRSTPEVGYEVERARPGELAGFLEATAAEVPDGILGWDYHLPAPTKSRVHRDWLASYATQELLLASDSGRPAGLLAGHVREEAVRYLGFGVGTVDFVAAAPEYRNNGVALRLVSDSLDMFKSRGVRLAVVVARPGDESLLRYCQTCGFATVETTVTLANWSDRN